MTEARKSSPSIPMGELDANTKRLGQFLELCAVSIRSELRGALSREERPDESVKRIASELSLLLKDKLKHYRDQMEKWSAGARKDQPEPFPKNMTRAWIKMVYVNNLRDDRRKEANPYGYYRHATSRAIKENAQAGGGVFIDKPKKWRLYSFRPIPPGASGCSIQQIEGETSPFVNWPRPRVSPDILWKSADRQSLVELAKEFWEEAARRRGRAEPMTLNALMHYLCAHYWFFEQLETRELDDDLDSTNDLEPVLNKEFLRKSLEGCVSTWKPEWRKLLWYKRFTELNDQDICRTCGITRLTHPLKRMGEDIQKTLSSLSIDYDSEDVTFLWVWDCLFDICSAEIPTELIQSRDTRPR